MLQIGEHSFGYPAVDRTPQPAYPEQPTLRILPGPRDSWFVENVLTTLCGPHGYQVTPQSNRISIRLHGPQLRRRHTRELPPEPAVPGALQIAPSGQPSLFLIDHPTTAHNPVIAVVHPDDLPTAAQTRPGQHIRFHLDQTE